ncbi:MAG: putative toxin-antitoxin system toxin component, PIN family [Deltaproteobacteria bacterium]|nr:putative toxin-antitoxin system toxin component, PIN family [Deltaproteobacteria bacterium]
MPRKHVVVLDTNVFVSGLISAKGAPGALLLRFRQGSFEIVTSKAQLREIRSVLSRPSLGRALPKGTAREVLRFFLAFKKLTRVFDPPRLPWEFKDVDDHFLLDLAVYSRADFLVTGDKALRSLALVGRCAVVSPTEFLGRL